MMVEQGELGLRALENRMSRQRNSVRSAFTLIELLVVIGIIAVLAGIGLSVGFGVLQSTRTSATTNTIQLLEGYLSDVNNSSQGPRDYRAFETTFDGDEYVLPVMDGRESSAGFGKVSDPAMPSLARFLAAGDTFVGDSSDRWGALDSDLVGDVVFAQGSGESLRSVTLLDQWGNPIRAVHPSFDGGFGDYFDGSSLATRPTLQNIDVVEGGSTSRVNLRRSYRPFATDNPDYVGDADEGICPNEAVYFYSAGPDGDPGTREDNVYGSVQPSYPAETRDFE